MYKEALSVLGIAGVLTAGVKLGEEIQDPHVYIEGNRVTIEFDTKEHGACHAGVHNGLPPHVFCDDVYHLP